MKGDTPFVMMMESTDVHDLDHTSVIIFVNLAMLRAIDLKQQVRARPVVARSERMPSMSSNQWRR